MSKFVRNSALYLIATIVLKATTFLLLPLYSHLVSPDAYGKVYIISSFISFFSLFLAFSMNGAIQRYFFECKNNIEVKIMYSTVTLFVFLISTGICAIMTLFSTVIAGWLNVPKIYLWLGIATVYFSLFYNLIIALLYVKQEALKISIVSIVIGVIQIVAQLLLVLNMQDKALGIILSMAISGILHLFIFLIFSRKYLVLSFDFQKLKRYFVYGISQFPSDISTWIVSFFDRLILNRYQNSAVVGIYGMGNTLASIPNVLFQSMNKALSPIVFENYKQYEIKNDESLASASRIIEKVFVFITMIVAIVTVFSNNIVNILSPSYSESGTVMFLVLIAVLFDIYRILFMYPMTYKIEYVKIKSAIWVGVSILSIVLNILLIPKYSYMGACYTLLLVNCSTFALIFYFANKAMHPKYQLKKLIGVFLLTFFFICAFFLGGSLKMFFMKLLLSALYVFAVYKVYPFEIKNIKYLLKR